MSLLETIIGGLLGRSQSGGSGLQSVLTNLMSDQQGGGLVAQLEQGGLGNAVQSWLGDGPNQPVSPAELHGALGADQVQSMANEAGMQPHDLLAQLAQHLPQIVEGLKQNGVFGR